MLMEGFIDQSTADIAADLYTDCKGELLFKLNVAVRKGERSKVQESNHQYLVLSILSLHVHRL